jgi:phosphogluconate dehydratase
VTPEAANGGPIAKIRDGDLIRLDAPNGRLEVLVDAAEWEARANENYDLSDSHTGIGRDLFAAFRATVCRADQGASIFAMHA